METFPPDTPHQHPHVAGQEPANRRGRLDEMLASRPSQDDLQNDGVLKFSNQLSANLQPVAQVLSMKLRHDFLSKDLSRRSDVEEPEVARILKRAEPSIVANSLLERVVTLDRKMSSDHVSHLLETRPLFEETSVSHSCPHVSPAIAPQVSNMEHRIASLQVKKKIERRPSADDLLHRNILLPIHDQIAPSLSGVSVDLDRNLKRDFLSRSLSHRSSAGIVDMGLIHEEKEE